MWMMAKATDDAEPGQVGEVTRYWYLAVRGRFAGTGGLSFMMLSGSKVGRWLVASFCNGVRYRPPARLVALGATVQRAGRYPPA
jgi:hypothetical protein